MKKSRLGLRIFLSVITTIVMFMLTINVIPPSKVVDYNPFLKQGEKLPMVAAHRGGATTNPQNTMKAFKSAVNEYQVDIIESDLYLTSDGYLIFNHDDYIDETCNINGDMSYEDVRDLPKDKRHYIKDMTLEQLRNYNFGHFFKDKYNNSNMPYHNLTSIDQENNQLVLKDNDLQIVEASEFFNEFYKDHKDLLFILEIKDEGDRGKLASDKLITMLKDSYPEYLDNLVIGTFHPEIEEYLSTNYKEIYKGASTTGAAGFIISEYLKVNLFYTPGYSCLQIPMSYEIKGIEIPLDSKDIIKKAHQRNMAVQYWTINDKDEMHRVIDLNCDAIMTDDLKLIYEVYNEYK